MRKKFGNKKNQSLINVGFFFKNLKS